MFIIFMISFQKPLKRMVIQEVGKGVAEEKQRRREQRAQAKTDTVQPNGDESQRQIPTADTVKEKDQKIQEIKSRTEDNRTENKENLNNVVTEKDQGHSNQKSKAAAENAKVPSVSASKPTVPGIPSSSFQLQADWKKLKGYPDLLFEYFKVLLQDVDTLDHQLFAHQVWFLCVCSLVSYDFRHKHGCYVNSIEFLYTHTIKQHNGNVQTILYTLTKSQASHDYNYKDEFLVYLMFVSF